ncbi:MAG: NAD(P)H-hydrate epimerase [Planctomycetota bacterium]
MEPGLPDVLSVDRVRDLDRRAVEELAIPSILLMEHASLNAAELAWELLPGRTKPVLALCGPGNNGGDGLALARHLRRRDPSRRVAAALTAAPDRYTGDAATNLRMARSFGVELFVTEGAFERWPAGPSLVIDAMLGTGASGPLRHPIRGLVERLNGTARGHDSARVLALDCPTGLNASTGEPWEDGLAVRADLTVTFAAMKPGLTSESARRFTGEVRCVGIGLPSGYGGQGSRNSD